MLCNVGGVKCQPLLKHSKHWKRTLKMFLKVTVCFFAIYMISYQFNKKSFIFTPMLPASAKVGQKKSIGFQKRAVKMQF